MHPGKFLLNNYLIPENLTVGDFSKISKLNKDWLLEFIQGEVELDSHSLALLADSTPYSKDFWMKLKDI